MTDLVEKLIDDLTAEVERQETVLAVCRAQLEAVHANDVAAIQARTEALATLVRETAHAQASRGALLVSVAKQLDLRAEQRTMTGLANALAEPWAGRVRHIQRRLRDAITETRRVVRLNALGLRRSLDFNQRLLACIALGPQPQSVYSDGSDRYATAGRPALIDQRG